MTFQEFTQSLVAHQPPTMLSEVCLALWYEAKGDWHKAHEIAQSREGTQAYDLLHAYLHRKEGDTWNAGYWYRRARAQMPDDSLEKEWARLVQQWL